MQVGFKVVLPLHFCVCISNIALCKVQWFYIPSFSSGSVLYIYTCHMQFMKIFILNVKKQLMLSR